MLLAIVIPVGLFLFTVPCNKKHKNIAWIAYVLFVVLYCFRGRLATDWQAYEMYYNNVFNESIISLSGFEIGFLWLCKLFNWLGLSYWALNFTLSLIIACVFGKAIKIYTDNIGIALLLGTLYFFYPSLEALRQMLAVVLFMYSLQYLDSKPKKYLLLNILSLFFHRTALLSIIFWVFYRYQKTRAPFIIGLTAFPLLQPLIEIPLRYIPRLYEKYHWYFIYKDGAEDYSYIFSFKTLEYVIVIITLLFLMKKQKNSYEIFESREVIYKKSCKISSSLTMEKIVILLLVFGLTIHICMGKIMDSSYRLLYYSDIALILGGCYIYDRFKQLLQKGLMIASISIYVILKFASIIWANPDLFNIC